MKKHWITTLGGVLAALPSLLGLVGVGHIGHVGATTVDGLLAGVGILILGGAAADANKTESK